MRVLWFTNAPFPAAGPTFGGSDAGSGGWMWGLASAMQQYSPVSLGVLSACCGGSNVDVRVHGVTHFRAAVPQDEFAQVTQLMPDSSFIKRCQEVVAEFKPDLLHIHGTEQTYGLLTCEGKLKLPTVISIQGLIGAYLPQYLGGITIPELLVMNSAANCVFRQGIIFEWLHWRQRLKVEERILCGNRHFIGRTLWDKSHLHNINQNAIYHHCDEVLRPVFYEKNSPAQKECRQTIFAIWGHYPLKGTHVLLRAFAGVKKYFPQVRLRLAGGAFKRSRWFRGYWSQLDRLIRDLDLANSVTLLPRLNAEQYAEELMNADVFALSSFIENSPNSLCEAMLMGTPCVVSYVGGVPSLVRDEETALCFPPGEHIVLAQQLRRILSDANLSEQISKNAREVAENRHNRQAVVNNMVEIYKKVL